MALLEDIRQQNLDESNAGIEASRRFFKGKGCRLRHLADLYGFETPSPCGHCDRCSPRLAKQWFEPKALPRWLPCLSPLADWWGPLSHRPSATKPITSHEAVWPCQGQPCSVPASPSHVVNLLAILSAVHFRAAHRKTALSEAAIPCLPMNSP